MVEQGQGIEWMGALHRAARFKKKHFVLSDLWRLYSTTVSKWNLMLDSVLERA